MYLIEDETLMSIEGEEDEDDAEDMDDEIYLEDEEV